MSQSSPAGLRCQGRERVAGAVFAVALVVAFAAACSNRESTFILERINHGDALSLVFDKTPGIIKVTARDDSDPKAKIVFDGTPAGTTLTVELRDYADKFVEITIERDRRVALLDAKIVNNAPRSDGVDYRAGGAKPNVVIFLVDALRADRLGVYGYAKPTSPNVDAFAKNSVVYENAYAPATWTRASVASLFTGRYPTAPGGTTRDDLFSSKLPTLAEEMKRNGYHTLGVVSNGNVAPELGFGRGFEEYIYIPENPQGHAMYSSAAEVIATAEARIATGEGKPFFLYIHVTDPHAPYTPPTEFAKSFIPADAVETPSSMETFQKFVWRNPEATAAQAKYLSGLYDGEVAAVDREFGGFVKWLEANGLMENTIIVFTSDHGEEFFEHRGFGHGNTVYEEVARVPLIARYPKAGIAKRIADVASLTDLMPLILKTLGFEVPPGLDGGSNRNGDAFVYEKLDKVEKEALLMFPFKLIRNSNRSNQWGEPVLEYEFYNIVDDPAETADVSRKNKIAFAVMKDKLEKARAKHVKPPDSAPPGGISDALKERLRALGY